jgi:AAA domain
VGQARSPQPDYNLRGERAEPVFIGMSGVTPRKVEFLDEGRIPLGALTILMGDPGVGKSMLSLAIATRWAKKRVILLTAEDALAQVVRPRLDMLGANASRFEVLAAMRDEDALDSTGDRAPALPQDVWALEEALSGRLYDLVIIDPINAFLPGDLDAHRDVAVRSVLAPLAGLAERSGVAMLAIMHLTKGGRDRALYRAQGSIAYVAAARSVLLAGIDPTDASRQRRVLLHEKNNVGREMEGLVFEIVDGQFYWRGATEMTSAALLAPTPTVEAADDHDEAVQALRQLLDDNGGELDAKQGRDRMRELQLSDATIRRARKQLCGQPRKEGFGKTGRWVWSLRCEPPKGTKINILNTLGDGLDNRPLSSVAKDVKDA